MKRTLSILLAVMMLVMLSGCDSWLTGSYASVKPHQEFYLEQSGDTLEASSISEITAILKEQIANGTENCMIYVTILDTAELEPAMITAVNSITQTDPIGAFAVENISYEIGTSTGRTAIAVNIKYNCSRSEILRIKDVDDMDGAMHVIAESLEDCDTNVVVLVKEYSYVDITQRIQDYVDANPNVCMEMPQVTADVYPDTGAVRVIALTFTYQTSRDVLRMMQNYVQPVFHAASLNVSGEDEESVMFSRMYAFLMERNDYQVETSITPAYSLLRHGVGDSKAFATVYAAMCSDAGLECHVISGTRSGEPWVWNLICQDGVYYHVDLLRSNAAGELNLHSDNEMDGYVWDYTAYPAAEAPAVTVHPEVPSNPDETTPEETTPPEDIPEETLPEPDDTVTETLPEE